ncbi:hypothetical protein J6590_096472 [Homalodisca vitripennis]|nr:hypothetical protein J6590_096472 [Homalodisca vitripennis]
MALDIFLLPKNVVTNGLCPCEYLYVSAFLPLYPPLTTLSFSIAYNQVFLNP